MLEFWFSSSYQELGFDGVVDLGVSTFPLLVANAAVPLFLLGPTCLGNFTVPLYSRQSIFHRMHSSPMRPNLSQLRHHCRLLASCRIPTPVGPFSE
jgi:hypothetical protein